MSSRFDEMNALRTSTGNDKVESKCSEFSNHALNHQLSLICAINESFHLRKFCATKMKKGSRDCIESKKIMKRKDLFGFRSGSALGRCL
jgi:hypothetical protein